MAEKDRLQEIETASNPEPRCACVLLLDTSGSMQGEKISSLNKGLRTFKEELAKDVLASLRTEIGIVTFDSDIKVTQPFANVESFKPPTLTAQGLTHMGAGVHKALDLIEAQKTEYRAQGLSYYRPWVFMITDGEPQGEEDSVVIGAAQRVREAEEGRRVVFFAVGVDDANMARLSQITVRPPLKLSGLDFGELFVWLSASIGAVARSRPDDDVQVPLTRPGWTKV